MTDPPLTGPRRSPAALAGLLLAATLAAAAAPAAGKGPPARGPRPRLGELVDVCLSGKPTGRGYCEGVAAGVAQVMEINGAAYRSSVGRDRPDDSWLTATSSCPGPTDRDLSASWFCRGYGIGFNQAMASNKAAARDDARSYSDDRIWLVIAGLCPAGPPPSSARLVQAFLDWSTLHEDASNELPVFGLISAFSAKWPCKQ